MNEFFEDHVIPFGDAFHHEATADCACGPKVEPIERDGTMTWEVVHHPLEVRSEPCPWRLHWLHILTYWGVLLWRLSPRDWWRLYRAGHYAVADRMGGVVWKGRKTKQDH